MVVAVNKALCDTHKVNEDVCEKMTSVMPMSSSADMASNKSKPMESGESSMNSVEEISPQESTNVFTSNSTEVVCLENETGVYVETDSILRKKVEKSIGDADKEHDQEIKNGTANQSKALYKDRTVNEAEESPISGKNLTTGCVPSTTVPVVASFHPGVDSKNEVARTMEREQDSTHTKSIISVCAKNRGDNSAHIELKGDDYNNSKQAVLISKCSFNSTNITSCVENVNILDKDLLSQKSQSCMQVDHEMLSDRIIATSTTNTTVNKSNSRKGVERKVSPVFNRGVFPRIVMRDSNIHTIRRLFRHLGMSNDIVNNKCSSSAADKSSNVESKQMKHEKNKREVEEKNSSQCMTESGEVTYFTTDIKLKSAEVCLLRLDEHTLLKYGMSLQNLQTDALVNCHQNRNCTLNVQFATFDKEATGSDNMFNTKIIESLCMNDRLNSVEQVQRTCNTGSDNLKHRKTKENINLRVSDGDFKSGFPKLSRKQSKTESMEHISDRSTENADCLPDSLKRETKLKQKRNAEDAARSSLKGRLVKHMGRKKLKITKEWGNSLTSDDIDIESGFPNPSRNVKSIPDTSIENNDCLPDTLKRKTESERKNTMDAAVSSLETHVSTPSGKVKLKIARVHVLKIDDNTLSKYGYDLRDLKTLNVSTVLSDNGNSSDMLKTGLDDICKEDTQDCVYDKCYLKKSYGSVSTIETYYSTPKQNVLKIDLSPVANPRKKRKFDIPPNNSVGVVNNFHNSYMNTKIAQISVTKIDNVLLSNHGITLQESHMKCPPKHKIRGITASKISNKNSDNTCKQNSYFNNILFSGKQREFEPVECTVNVCRLDMETLKKQGAKVDVNKDNGEDHCKENINVGGGKELIKCARVNLSRLDKAAISKFHVANTLVPSE